MGLLDDAIREHLELKRLRGADLGVVAREEREALGPVHRGDDAVDEEHQDDRPEESPAGQGSFGQSESAPVADLSTIGQETAEIDMNAVLDSDWDVKSTPDASGDEQVTPIAHSAHARSDAEDSLEWEVPDQEIKEHPDDSDPESAAQVDDVLEETPDFLRDTPEQERLWFEQRPPRDFDFNE
jgi:hypothetical protein